MAFIPGEQLITQSTPYEVFLTILPAVLFSSIAALLASKTGGAVTCNKFYHFIFDFVLIIVPLIFTFTILSEYVREISFICGFVVLFLLALDRVCLLGNKSATSSRLRWNTHFITNARATINVLTVFAILAVDFSIFPREFAKNNNYGYSLMDTGVGLFIYSNGIVAPETKRKRDAIRKSVKGSLILIILGFARLIVTKQVGYHVSELEYGVHWNFFFTLAFTKIFTSLVLNFFKIRYIYANAFLLILSHEMLLQSGLKDFVMNRNRGDALFTANKEGIVSLIGYISIYLFSVYFGYILNKIKNKGSFYSVLAFVFASGASLILSCLFQYFFDISRRLANAAYCFWVLFIGISMTGLYYLFQVLQESHFRLKRPVYVYSPFIFEAANFNGLTLFLIANLLTGLVNLSINTMSQSHFVSLVILGCYMFVNCLIVSVLYVKKIKLKL